MKHINFVLILFILIGVFPAMTVYSQTNLDRFEIVKKIELDSLPLELKSKAAIFLNAIDFNMKLKKLPGLSIFDHHISDEISFLKDSTTTERGSVSTSYYYEDSKLMEKKTSNNPGRSFSASYNYDEQDQLIEEITPVEKVVYNYENGKIKTYTANNSNTEVKLEFLNELSEVRNTRRGGKDISRDTIEYNLDGKIVEAKTFRYDFYQTIDNYKNSFNKDGYVSSQTFEQKSSLEEKVISHYVGRETRTYNNNAWITSQVKGATNKANYTKLIFYDRQFSYESYLNKDGQYVLVKNTQGKKHKKHSQDIYVLDENYNWIVHERFEQGEYVSTKYRKIDYVIK